MVDSVDTLLIRMCATDAESSVRRDAANQLGSRPAYELTAAQMSRVVRALANSHNCAVGGGAISVRRAALLAFTQLCGEPGLHSAACRSELSELLADADPDVREMAARAMAALGAHADRLAVAALLEDVDDVRSAAVDTLVALGAHLDSADLAFIASGLSHQDDAVKVAALSALRGAEGLAAAHSGEIAACTTDEHEDVRAAAASALGAVGGDGVTGILASLLGDEAARVRIAAVGALGELPASYGAQDLVDDVSELLGDADRGVRSAVSWRLKRWGVA
jgi:HEAT repeat protein